MSIYSSHPIHLPFLAWVAVRPSHLQSLGAVGAQDLSLGKNGSAVGQPEGHITEICKESLGQPQPKALDVKHLRNQNFSDM